MTFLICAAPLAHAQQSPTRPATAPEADPAKLDADKERDREFQRLENDTRFYPTTRAAKIADVIDLTLNENNLVLRTTLPPKKGEVRLLIDDAPRSVVTAAADGGDAQKGFYQPNSFKFIQFDFSDPKLLITGTNILSSPGHLTISRDTEAASWMQSVELIQSGGYLLQEDSDGEKIKLFINRSSEPPQATDVKLTLSAKDFVDLRQKYPKESSLYLEPLFRDLGQSSVLFHVDPKLAWQALAGAFDVPADVEEKVAALVKQLDADEPRTREEASQALETLGQPAALALMKFDRQGLSEEQTSRIDAFLAAYKPVKDEEAAAFARDPEFLAVTLAAEDPALRKLALDALKKAAGRPIEFDLDADAPARLEAALKLRGELAPPATQSDTQPPTQPAAQREVPPELRDAGP